MRRSHGSLRALFAIGPSRVVLASLVLCAGDVANAQSALRSAAVDASGGLGYGFGGAQVADRAFVDAALTIAAPVRRLRHGALVAGVNASLDLLWSTHDCLSEPNNLLLRCRVFPSYSSVGVVGGWSMRGNQENGVRMLIGPAYIYSSNSTHQFGAVTRVDAAERMTHHLSFVFWGQGLFPTADQGEHHAVVSGGVGLRVH